MKHEEQKAFTCCKRHLRIRDKIRSLRALPFISMQKEVTICCLKLSPPHFFFPSLFFNFNFSSEVAHPSGLHVKRPYTGTGRFFLELSAIPWNTMILSNHHFSIDYTVCSLYTLANIPRMSALEMQILRAGIQVLTAYSLLLILLTNLSHLPHTSCLSHTLVKDGNNSQLFGFCTLNSRQ